MRLYFPVLRLFQTRLWRTGCLGRPPCPADTFPRFCFVHPVAGCLRPASTTNKPACSPVAQACPYNKFHQVDIAQPPGPARQLFAAKQQNLQDLALPRREDSNTPSPAYKGRQHGPSLQIACSIHVLFPGLGQCSRPRQSFSQSGIPYLRWMMLFFPQHAGTCGPLRVT